MKNINENQLRNAVRNTIQEIIENRELYFIEDEADGAVHEITSDKDEAIADAQEMASTGGRFLVKDIMDNIVFDTGGPSYKFEQKQLPIIKMEESEMRNLISNTIMECFKRIQTT